MHSTTSLCNICLKEIPARILKKDRFIYIDKECSEHGKFSSKHFWDDPEIYENLKKIKTFNPQSANLSIALTHKCNLNCPVCYARANEATLPDFPLKNLRILKKYKTALLTGGEPTTRKDLPKIIRTIRKNKKRAVIFTNGIKLANKKYLRKLVDSGLNSVILQYDSANRETMIRIRGENLVGTKLKAIRNLQKYPIPVYLYSVILKGRHPFEINKLFNLFFKYPSIKMISFNILGVLGRCNSKDFLPSSEIIKEVCKLLDITKEEWVDSSRFLNSIDALFSKRRNGRRLFSKCFLKLLFIHENRRVIPISKILNVKEINRRVEELSESNLKLARKGNFFLWFLSDQIVLNFIINKNFRILVKKIFLNLKFLLKKRFSLANPFSFLAVTVVLNKENVDFSFLKECNDHAVSSQNISPEPACLYRIKEDFKNEALSNK